MKSPASWKSRVFALALGTAISLAPSASAASFGADSELTATAPFTFSNTTTSGRFSVTANEPVNFTFYQGAYAGQTFLATLNLSITTTATATNAGPFDAQPFNQLGSFAIHLNAPLGGYSNALSGTFTGTITGFDGDTNASFGASTSQGNSVTFTSDFATFSGSESILLTSTDLNPGLSIGPGGFLDSFTGDFTPGTFSADTIISSAAPEPASASLLVFGGVALGTMMRRRRLKN